jgi:hypothetical protein
VAQFIVAVGQVRGPRSVNEAAVGVRSFLRWCYQIGLITAPLAPATPWLARARAASLPRGVPAGTGERLLASCDPASVFGVGGADGADPP